MKLRQFALAEKIKNQNGFTLSEALFSTGILVMLFLVMGMVFSKGNNLFDVVSAESQAQRNSRRILQSVSSISRQPNRPDPNGITLPSSSHFFFFFPFYQQAQNVCS